MSDGRDRLAMTIDLRLADLWAEVFEVDVERIDTELLGWLLRAARRGQLCLDLGYAVPERTA